MRNALMHMAGLRRGRHALKADVAMLALHAALTLAGLVSHQIQSHHDATLPRRDRWEVTR